MIRSDSILIIVILFLLASCTSKVPHISVNHKYEYEVIASILNAKFEYTTNDAHNYAHVAAFNNQFLNIEKMTSLDRLFECYDFSRDYNISLAKTIIIELSR